ncbi:MAG: hypothetical protein PHD51_03735 [Patescibacteria group bacterium]|nr:hypothetical protein [Patescibacteria group bacterium]MDD5490918.1 hypothetical protein [Patescibacteria group bacterium]
MNTDYFRWGGGTTIEGHYLEIPRLSLNTRQHELPPINRARKIELHHLHNGDYENCELIITWETRDEGAIFEAVCKLNDDCLKKQFKKNPVFLDKLLDFIQKCQEDQEKKPEALELGGKIVLSDVPPDFREAVKQIKIWAEFLYPFWEDISWSQRVLFEKARISKEGYYQFIINWYHLKLSKEKRCPHNSHELAFDFDPPPQTNEHAAWWTLEDEKIQIVLPHEHSDQQIADYYGYGKVYEQYLKNKGAKEQEGKEMEKAWREQRKKDEEEQKKKLEKVKSELLS